MSRSVVQSLDTKLSELRSGGLKGKIRIGMADDHTPIGRGSILSAFSTSPRNGA